MRNNSVTSTGQTHSVAVEGVKKIFRADVLLESLPVRTLITLCCKPILNTSFVAPKVQ